MKGIQRNGFLPIIAQAISEMEEIHGDFQVWMRLILRNLAVGQDFQEPNCAV